MANLYIWNTRKYGTHCEICASSAGNILPMDEWRSLPMPGFHFGCGCSLSVYGVITPPPIGPPAFICPTCGEGFETQAQLDQHRLIHLAPPVYPYKCSVCGAGFWQEDARNDHENTHADSYWCGVCGDGFKTLAGLQSHLKDAHQITPPPPPGNFVCPYCGDDFQTSGDLDRHMQDSHG